ncbi:MAG: ATP-binding cassette domain-containing protein [Acidobacteria bacterium]|nr:ATP-binding cassette domain-containing protein [Acidobacteriota bacterium]MCB9398758.1 ATP-binding cassette domain-containing protein [Acidobacteriota bacterium]
MILKVQNLYKSFGPVKAVQGISFDVQRGGIVGLLGPNGAGKTTLIRLIMDIYMPDGGEIVLSEELAGKNRKNHIGYLPEERGLYTKEKVYDTLMYFGVLKGLSRDQAKENVNHFLTRLDMDQYRKTKLLKLSKGNQQKIQLISALVSKPPLLILDEPFSGLDPINTRMVIAVLHELKQQGISIMLSTHQMDRVEDLCDNILLVNKGHLLLNGPTQDVIQRFSGQYWQISGPQLPEHPGYTIAEYQNGLSKIHLNAGFSQADLLRFLAELPEPIASLSPFKRPLSDIFIQVVEEAGHEQN